MTVQIAGVANTQFDDCPDSSTRERVTDAALEAVGDRDDRQFDFSVP
ncbi:hypothetical protein [Natronobacterium texcoconense]|uniref:Acetyl-CoA C-acetyltransferase n=1 Tax=Natronobacterium texcoconense TaxID=1095778 RepID=A0A1H1BYY2_NATTX|nr:hypothetical protein [Natronobacterium texcoconense]SDQ57144.1 acetyl-CoA C-acetyltransferase [Natronobacterium texcoconense]